MGRLSGNQQLARARKRNWREGREIGRERGGKQRQEREGNTPVTPNRGEKREELSPLTPPAQIRYSSAGLPLSGQAPPPQALPLSGQDPSPPAIPLSGQAPRPPAALSQGTAPLCLSFPLTCPCFLMVLLLVPHCFASKLALCLVYACVDVVLCLCPLPTALYYSSVSCKL